MVASFLASAGLAQDAKPNFADIQRALAIRGYNVGQVDGLWGRRSINALAAFQKAEGLSATGELDRATLSRLLQPVQPAPSANTNAGSVAGSDPVSAPPAGQPTSPPAPGPAAVSPVKSEPFPSPATPVAEHAPADVTSSGSGFGWLIAIVSALSVVGLISRRRRRSMVGSPNLSRRGREGRLGSVQAHDQPSKATVLTVTNVPEMALAPGADLAAHHAGTTLFIQARDLQQKAAKEISSTDEVKKQSAMEAIHLDGLDDELADTLRTSLAEYNSIIAPSAPSTYHSLRASEGHVSADDDRTSAAISPAATLVSQRKESLATHNAKVAKVIADQNFFAAGGAEEKRTFLERLIRAARRDEAPRADGWIAAGHPVQIGSHHIAGGMIYVGRHLLQRENARQAENCLIDPDLPVAMHRDDPSGATMGYWPSYSTISPEARKSYLDWLAGDRSDPETYIGYVFLYFYGLERRLMLDDAANDTDALAAEVRRLLSIYGSHHSFRRYAQELLGALELRQAEPPHTVIPDAEATGHDIPLHIKAALGARVRDGRDIEPDLLLAYVLSHPETNARTPAKRAPEELRALFSAAVARAHPKGVKVAMGRTKILKSTYRACSGTFTVNVQPFGGNVPDITEGSQPLELGREIFQSCVEQLDAYSRALGRLPGMTPNLAAVALLPSDIRRRQADRIPGAPLARIEALADGAVASSVEELITLVGLDNAAAFSRAKLKDLAAVLSAFGYGITADPAFSLRTAKLGEPAIVFPLGSEVDASLTPTPDYRKVQATVMLGMLVASADGTLHEDERKRLVADIDGAVGLSSEERRRLKAELLVNERSGRAGDWIKALKEMETEDGAWVADVLIGIAAADGRIDAQEVTTLEKLFRQLGLDEASLYTRLHGRVAVHEQERDEDLEVVISPTPEAPGTAIPPPPSSTRPVEPRAKVDLSRLEAIRRETLTAARVLSDIFAEDEEAAESPQPEPEHVQEAGTAMFEGLDQRYGRLLAELSEREEWALADFEYLTRDAGLMSAAARQVLNEWALDHFDELLIEGDDPIMINRQLLSLPGETITVSHSADLRAHA